MAEKSSYKMLGNPAKLCSMMQESISLSASNSVSIKEVRMMIESLNEGVWSKKEIIDLFTKSPQKIFVLHGDHLFLKKSCEKVSKAGKAEVSDSNASCVLERFPVVTETAEKEVSEGVESCDLCENVAAKADELYRRIGVLERHIAQKLELLKLKQRSVRHLRRTIKSSRAAVDPYTYDDVRPLSTTDCSTARRPGTSHSPISGK
ncbi:uncharacterized protein LOC111272194 isoform X2 [Varroa jacobsoni]|nr:uncharacterized protein LOC111272194 isoform X2 [Varroa jacobsoni]XP_022709229.1 uncharacterized protein LOC111272194 isoform X2 [Varroa jacobsoni]XP_022709230.1 uncharacterized protein LOC111272194 isoform X2 [Varroa jacobsoni]XP_022709231.1 uncharacterized protein LOC111272194 isoform X2 [Varroa jacobsoni]XP_022709233.1 uncharacterized protein LOC111272194 isoform X2 [Varroa jacobsoni]